MNSTYTTHQLDRRSDRILRSVRSGAVRPGSDAIRELAELHLALEDAPVKKGTVVARLIVTRQNGTRTIVEVFKDATFASFFRFFRQEGNRRSTKRHTRCGCRNEGLIPGAWGLEGIAWKLAKYQSQSNPVTDSQIKIYRKRDYKRLLTCSPDQLGLTRSKSKLTVERFAPWAQGGRS